MTMREMILQKLNGFLKDDPRYGIPRYFDCYDDDYIRDMSELEKMSDEELLEVFEATVGYRG